MIVHTLYHVAIVTHLQSSRNMTSCDFSVGLGQKSCFGQWDMGRCVASRDIKCYLWSSASSCAPAILNKSMSWLTTGKRRTPRALTQSQVWKQAQLTCSWPADPGTRKIMLVVIRHCILTWLFLHLSVTTADEVRTNGHFP